VTSNARLYFPDKDDFTALSNDEYVALHNQGKHHEIIDGSYRLITKIITKYGIKCSDDLFFDCLHSGLEALMEIVEKWNPDKSAWSTYSYWYIQKAIQNFLKQQGGLSYGSYDYYRKFSSNVVYLSDKVSSRLEHDGESWLLSDILKSNSDVIKEITEKESGKESEQKYRILQKHLHKKEIKALHILFGPTHHSRIHKMPMEDRLFLANEFLPVFRRRESWCKMKGSALLKGEIKKNASLYYLRNKMREKVKNILRRYK